MCARRIFFRIFLGIYSYLVLDVYIIKIFHYYVVKLLHRRDNVLDHIATGILRADLLDLIWGIYDTLQHTAITTGNLREGLVDLILGIYEYESGTKDTTKDVLRAAEKMVHTYLQKNYI